jgi:hypothetical protein
MTRTAWQRRGIFKLFLIACPVLAALIVFASDQPAVHVEPTDSVGPRVLEKQTETAVVRDYLKAWQSMSTALGQNRADLLNADFVGTAKEKLADTIREQAKLGIQTHYQDRSHDVQLVFYSPEGLSIQLVDTVEYDVQLLDQEKLQTTQHVRARYVAVLTPTEVQWKVRVFQAEPQ